MFVDISINIGLVIITCSAVIVTCDQAVLFLFDFFLACESIRRVKLET